MPEFTLALDIGTTSLRAVLFDESWSVVGQSSDTIESTAPQPGWLEQNPESIWTKTIDCAKSAIQHASISVSVITSIGITTQRASCMIWERKSGIPLTPLISWQDMRGIQRAKDLTELGFPTMPPAASCKLEAALSSVSNGHTRMTAGELCWGNIDSYILFRLSNGAVHATDHSQACATGYYDLETGDWNHELIEVQHLSESLFPTLIDTGSEIGETTSGLFGASIPIQSVVGDQQSSTIAQGCANPGDLKFTFGTSGTCNINTGDQVASIPGMYPLVLDHFDGRSTFCAEAMIITAGAMLNWTEHTFNAPDLFRDIDNTADSAGVFVLPALQGLGSPHGNPKQTATLTGLTRSTSIHHIAQATLEGICFRAREIFDTVREKSPHPVPSTIAVDGGLSTNQHFIQLLADINGVDIAVSPEQEATALGAALLARHGSQWGQFSVDSQGQQTIIHAQSEKSSYYAEKFDQWKDVFFTD